MASRKLQFREDALSTENTNAKPRSLEGETTQLRSMGELLIKSAYPTKASRMRIGCLSFHLSKIVA